MNNEISTKHRHFVDYESSGVLTLKLITLFK